jgi:hypothetical protein
LIDWEHLIRSAAGVLCNAGMGTGICLGFFCCLLMGAFLLQQVTGSLFEKLFSLLGRGGIFWAFPGVVIHETGHLLFCLLFHHRIVKVDFFKPEKDGTLGKVQSVWDKKSFFQRAGQFFIGIGPIILGTALISCCTAWLLPEVWQKLTLQHFETWRDLAPGIFILAGRMFRTLFCAALWCKWQTWLWLVITLMIGTTVTLSKEDLKGVFWGIVFVPLILFVLNLLLGIFCDPELLFRYASAFCGCLLAIMLFLFLILFSCRLLLCFPLFQKEERKR